ncbi:MAG TPA: glycosyltransferase family 39 protein [Phototrophicaceae bacterium]|nr:glycosyltransferase family 39 protein [Phototrophicaceae bacterium]
MPYWMSDTLAGTPAFLWIYVGLGGLGSLAILPRSEWRQRIQVITLAFALGPMLLTAWMFILGTIGAVSKTATLTMPSVLGGTVVLALIALVIVWRKIRARHASPLPITRSDHQSLLADERLLILLIVAALIVRWVVIAYWPFTAYDSLWVYGYEARLYALLGYIPQTIGYYPQFIPLQYAFAQLSGINDHVARASLIFLHAGSILATYVLGSRLSNRRAGLLAAAIWALYPAVGEWSRAGDLEIPLAFLFTLAAAFFLLAWFGREPRRRYALIAGLMLGVGLWTKPTMGAFILGVGLMVMLELARVRLNWRAAWPRVQVALLTGIAALPLGGIWYLRNITLGLPPLVFPPAFWETLAQRSGGEFGWPLALLVAWAIYLRVRYPRYDWRLGALGLLLVLIALVPTIIPQLFPSLLPVRPLSWIEFALLGVGLIVLAICVRRMARDLWDDDLRSIASLAGWGWALALPYFVVWFYDYSYHYRLSFAIVPLMILPLAAILARLFTPERIGVGARRFAYLLVIVLLAYPGVISAIADPNGGGDYLWTDKYPDDTARYRSGNAALMNVVDGLQIWLNQHPGQQLNVYAPGVDRLPFFFPLQNIDVNDVPTRLDQLGRADYLVYGEPETTGVYQNVPITDDQVIGALNRQDIMKRAWGMDDGIFKYDVYELHLDNRWTAPQPNGPAGHDVVFGDDVRYLGYDIGGLDLWPGRKVIAHFYWQALQPLPQDDSIYIHLRDQNDHLIASWDGPVAQGKLGYYSTLIWQAGEYISDQRVLTLPQGVDPTGKGYRLVIGIYNTATGDRLPVTVDGQPAGDGYVVENRINVLASQPP